MECIKEFKLKSGNTVKIFYDPDPINPRLDCCTLSKMVCFHGKYDLGDDHEYYGYEFDSWDDLKTVIIQDKKPLAILPVFLYDHSGILINTTGFTCKWDSGQIGWVYINKKKITELDCIKPATKTFKEYKEWLKQQILIEINLYNQYLTGDCYCYEIYDENNNYVDGCGGFYGTDWKTNGLTDYVDLILEN